MIEITIYERKDQEGSDQKRNVMLFVHGGGFIGGDVKTKRKSMPLSCAAVWCGCYLTRISSGTWNSISGSRRRRTGTIDWLEENADRFNIDTDKMAIMGESAGGHLAVNACLKDKKTKDETGSICVRSYGYECSRRYTISLGLLIIPDGGRTKRIISWTACSVLKS